MAIYQHVVFLYATAHLEHFVSVQTNWLLTCAGLHSNNSPRGIQGNQFTGSIDALGKLTKLFYLCVWMG